MVTELKHNLEDRQEEAVKVKQSDLKRIRAELLEKQGWRCAICGKDMLQAPASDACVDHCHTTGFIRGVLCRNCNRGEGKVRTQAIACKRGGTMLQFLGSVISYWSIHSTPQTNYIHPKHKTEAEKRLHRNAMARKRRKEKNG